MAPRLNADFLDLLASLRTHEVEHLIVGAFALAVHGVARATGDIDVWVRPSHANAARVVAAVTAFGAPLEAHGVDADAFVRPGTVYQLGLPPSRIDLLTRIDGVSFDDAWSGRVTATFDGLSVPVLGLAALRTNKAATGRAKDRADLAMLDELAASTSHQTD